MPERTQAIRDFDTFRQFITGGGIHAVWVPIYLFFLFILSPLLF